jgi:DNA polymerase-1
MEKKLIIIDGNSLFFRAYYATAFPGATIMSTKDGVPTNAIFAFGNMMVKILSSLKEGEAIFVAFDTDKKTFRHEQLETYKANRKAAPIELIKQFPIVREFLRALGVFQYEEPGYEADDIAGTVAKIAASENYEVEIYTSDKDYLQLIDKNIIINIIKKGLSDIQVVNLENVKEIYGFEPCNVVDYKGLRGDSSDNLPGIPGVGDKGAIKLINQYGTFDEIVKAMATEKGKVAESIVQNQELGRMCRDLAVIKTDMTLPFKIDEAIYKGYDFKTLNKFANRYEMKSFMNKIPSKWKKIDNLGIKIEAERINRLDIDLKDVTEIGIALDFADSSYNDSEIYGIALDIGEHHYYLEYQDFLIDTQAKELLKNENIKKFGYDIKAIKVALSRDNIEISGEIFDLLIATYLLDSSLKNSFVSTMHFFDIDLPSKEVSLLEIGNDLLTVQTAFYSKKLYEKVIVELEKIDALKLYETLELPLVDVLASLEIEGFPLDIKTLDSFGNEFKEKVEILTKEIHSLAGKDFNISSPKQLGEILFGELKLKPKTKKLSTSNEVLIELINEHPIISKLIEYRKYTKLISTYIEGLKGHVHEDGKIHAQFNQALTTTGRLSSSNPNLQNISVRDEDGKMIRKAFFYQDNNLEILSLDYAQIELRVLASLSKCKNMLEIFKSHEDIHSSTAKLIFHLDREPTSEERRKAKTVNFGIVYGISDWGLAERLGVDPKEAKIIINNFFKAFPEIAEFLSSVVDEALKNGYVSTLLGRRRYLREIHDSNYQARESAKRAAMNAPIQGTAADLIKLAMIDVYKALKDGHFKTKMVLQIHDELIFKVPSEEKEKVYNLVKDIMEHALDLKSGLEVDGGFAKDWYDAK